MNEVVYIQTKRYLIGCDLAKANDFTSFAVVEMEKVPAINDYKYHLLALDRVRGVDYPIIEGTITDLIEDLDSRGVNKAGIRTHKDGPHLCMDASGLGAPIRDYLKAKHIFSARRRFFPVVFVGGEAARYDKTTGNYNISKNLMVANFNALMQHKRLDYPPDLAMIELLLNEIAAFKYTQNASGHVSFNAEAGKHDDLICACLIPLAVGEIYFKQRVSTSMPKPVGL